MSTLANPAPTVVVVSPFDLVQIIDDEIAYCEALAEAEEIHAELEACDLCPVIHSDTVPGHWALWDVWQEWPDNLLAA